MPAAAVFAHGTVISEQPIHETKPIGLSIIRYGHALVTLESSFHVANSSKKIGTCREHLVTLHSVCDLIFGASRPKSCHHSGSSFLCSGERGATCARDACQHGAAMPLTAIHRRGKFSVLDAAIKSWSAPTRQNKNGVRVDPSIRVHLRHLHLCHSAIEPGLS